LDYFDVPGLVRTILKIVHVIVGLNVGGAESTLKRLLDSHAGQLDIEHHVISLTDLGVLGDGMIDQGIKVYCLDISSAAGVPKAVLKMRKLMKELGPDIVHTWMYHADLLGGIVAYSLGISNLVWCVRSTDIRKGGSKITLFIRKLCALLSGRLPKVIVCAANSSRNVHGEIGYKLKKMQVIPNGFDLHALTSSSQVANRDVRDELGISPSDELIISVGRFNPVKDHKNFIEAAGLLARERDNVKFILVGRDLNHSNLHLKAMIESAGSVSSFYLLDERDDIPSCLKASDIFCLHSLTEGFPNALGEAMALALPCVTTDAGDAGFLLNNPDWVVPVGSPKSLAITLNKMLSLPLSDRVSLGEKSALRIYDRFTIDRMSKQYFDLYRALLNCK
jgi:glycosyltransferase involved in cell wall biosynthesis